MWANMKCVQNVRKQQQKMKILLYTTTYKYNKETKTCLYLCENYFIDNSTELGRESHPIQSVLTRCFKLASNKGFAKVCSTKVFYYTILMHITTPRR